MSHITADISGFSGKYAGLNQQEKMLPTSLLQLAHAAMTVGQQGKIATAQLGFFRLAQLLCTILANVEKSNDRLRINSRHYSLEKSEKDVVSFLLGMAVTKHVASQLLNVPWVIHVSKYANIQLANSKKKVPPKRLLFKNHSKPKAPDLLGFDLNGDCHVFEAKGSCSGFKGATLQHAIDQVSQVQLVDGKAPSTLVACFADCSTSGINATVVDPAPPEIGISYEYDPDRIVRDYYIQFDRMFKSSDTHLIGKNEYLVRPIGVPNLFFGVRSDYLKIAREKGAYEQIMAIAQDFRGDSPGQGQEMSASKDGTILYSALSGTNKEPF